MFLNKMKKKIHKFLIPEGLSSDYSIFVISGYYIHCFAFGYRIKHSNLVLLVLVYSINFIFHLDLRIFKIFSKKTGAFVFKSLHNLCNVLKTLDFILFADDTKLFYSHKDPNQLTNVLNTELKKLFNWTRANNLFIYILLKNVLKQNKKAIT